MKLKPRWVRKAQSYCVTLLEGDVTLKGKTKKLQKIFWFSDLESAMKFYKDK